MPSHRPQHAGPAFLSPERIKRLAFDNSVLVIVGEAKVGKSDLAKQIHLAGPYRVSPMKSLNFMTLKDRDQRYGLFGGDPPELTDKRRGILEFPTTQLIKHIDFAYPFLQERLAAALAELFAARPLADWLALLDGEDVCVGPVATLAEAAADLGTPPHGRAAALGEHTAAWRAELGL